MLTDGDKLLDYPFDLYQRTRDITEIVEVIAGDLKKEKLKILDVGGFRIDAEDRNDLLLREFLPQHEIIALDLMESDIPGYVQGDGTCLPFKENTFDIVVTSDVFEHVPPESRELFVDNLVRVSRGFLILGAPFFTEKNELAEQILFDYVHKVLHAEQEQLKEHIENRLPDRQRLTDHFNKIKLPIIELSSGNLENWLMMMMVKHYLMSIPDSQEMHVKLDRFYNISSYESDHKGEGYRTIFVAALDKKKSKTLDHIKKHFDVFATQAKESAPFPMGDDMGRFRMLLDLEELRTRRMFEEKELIIQQQAAQINALNGLRSTKFFKLVRGIGKLAAAPFGKLPRFLKLKVLQISEVLSGKRKHFMLTVSAGKYRNWIKKHSPDTQQLADMQEDCKKWSSRPLISIVMPVYNTPGPFLDEAIQSVTAQLYDNWQLCIVNDGSTDMHVREILNSRQAGDKRIIVTHLHRNKGIAGATNRALAAAKGEFVLFMDSDDTLHQTALYKVVELLNREPAADFIFSDEDKLDLEGQRCKPVFKPGWSPELLLTYNYLNHLTVCRKSVLDQVGGFNRKYDWSQDYDLYLRITESTDHIFHIPEILYHWRAIPGSSAARVDFRTEALEKSRQLLIDTLKRRHINAAVVNGIRPGTFKIQYL